MRQSYEIMNNAKESVEQSVLKEKGRMHVP